MLKIDIPRYSVEAAIVKEAFTGAMWRIGNENATPMQIDVHQETALRRVLAGAGLEVSPETFNELMLSFDIVQEGICELIANIQGELRRD
jgi:hypothetical protein